VEDDELEGSTVVEPFVETCCFPDGIEVESDCVGRGDDCPRDDVVAIEE